jgi:hypothetical protein
MAGRVAYMKTRHEVLMEDMAFRRLLSIEALVAEASEVIARLMAEYGGPGAAAEQVARLGVATAERQGQYDGPHSG